MESVILCANSSTVSLVPNHVYVRHDSAASSHREVIEEVSLIQTHSTGRFMTWKRKVHAQRARQRSSATGKRYLSLNDFTTRSVTGGLNLLTFKKQAQRKGSPVKMGRELDAVL